MSSTNATVQEVESLWKARRNKAQVVLSIIHSLYVSVVDSRTIKSEKNS